MQFDSITFLIFFLVVALIYHALPGWREKKIWLVLVSCLFYAAWRPPLIILLAISIFVDWVAAANIARNERSAPRRFWLIVSLLINLGLLSYFKYIEWLTENLSTLSSIFEWQLDVPILNVLLPIGISFYTFQTLSYTIDVYRKRIPPAKSFLDFALFVSFFPQLVAGPIVRAAQFLPQLSRARIITRERLSRGLILFVFGLFAKVVLADAILAPVVDKVYAQQYIGFLDAWVTAFAFSGQIYFDFSGYTACALGIALVLGFTLPENFNAPYAAAGFSDFWRRWHISLSSWLRDYLYIPLGGSRHGRTRTLFSLMLTMFLGGLWHGAGWHFVIWGLLHGLYLALEHIGDKLWSGLRPFLGTLTGRLLVFVLVSLTWIMFRAENTEQAKTMFIALTGNGSANSLDLFNLITSSSVIVIMFLWQQYSRARSVHRIFSRWRTWLRSVILIFALVSIYVASRGDSRAFIYFQF